MKRIEIQVYNTLDLFALIPLELILFADLNPYLVSNSLAHWGGVIGSLVIWVCYLIHDKGIIKLNAYKIWLIAFVIYSNVTSIWAVSSEDVRKISIMLIELMPTLLCINHFINSKSNLILFLKLIIFTSVVNGLFYLPLIGSLRGLNVSNEMINANTIGLLMAISIWMIILLADIENRRLTVGDFLVIAYFMILLLASGSRKSIVMLLSLLLLRQVFVSRYKFLLFLRWIIIICMVLLALRYVPFLYNSIGVRLFEMFSVFSGNTSADFSTFQRLQFIQFGFEAFCDKPILGYGINNYHILALEHFNRVWYDTYSHNNYIEVLVSGGVVLFIIYYFIYIKCLIPLKNDNKINNWKTLYISLPIIISLLLTEVGMVDYYSILYQYLLCLAFASKQILND